MWNKKIELKETAALLTISGGDARKLLNLLELVIETLSSEENDIVIAEGEVQGKMKNGNSLDAVFCDVFEMTGGKIRTLTSYLMTLNTSIKFE